MGFYTGILLQTLARTTVAGAAAHAANQQPAAPPPRKRGGGCTGCKALKMVEKSRRAAGLPVAPPLTAKEARKAGVKVR